MRSIIVNRDGKDVKVLGMKVGSEIWVHVDGETLVYDSRPRASKKGKAETGDNGEIVAPMPGRILKVNSSIGATVQKGTVILIMEAMKMEYSLAAEIDGVVTQLNCKTGDQVSLNQTLAVVAKTIATKTAMDKT